MSARDSSTRRKPRNTVRQPRTSPHPDTSGRARFSDSLRVPHDLGGEPGGAITTDEREKEPWERNIYATCEALAWRGVWNNIEKLRRHADLGDSQYLSLPYYGRWLLAAARALVDKDHVTQTELANKIEEVKRRHER